MVKKTSHISHNKRNKIVTLTNIIGKDTDTSTTENTEIRHCCVIIEQRECDSGGGG